MIHHIGSLNEILRTFLHSDTAQEGDHLLLASMVRTRYVLKFLLEGIHGIVNRETLAGILMVVVDNSLTGELRNAHDAVGIVHTVLLDTIDGRIHLTAGTVKISSMHMDAERLSTHILGMDSSRIGQPVMSMNDIELFRTSHNTGNHRIVVDLIVQVTGITTCKLHGTQIIDVHIVEVGIDMLTKFVIVIRIHDVTHAILHIIVVNITVGNRHRIHGNDAGGMRLFISEWMRQTECNLDVTLSLQTFRNTIVGSSKTTKYMRRILPSKH